MNFISQPIQHILKKSEIKKKKIKESKRKKKNILGLIGKSMNQITRVITSNPQTSSEKKPKLDYF